MKIKCSQTIDVEKEVKLPYYCKKIYDRGTIIYREYDGEFFFKIFGEGENDTVEVRTGKFPMIKTTTTVDVIVTNYDYTTNDCTEAEFQLAFNTALKNLSK